MGDGEAGACGAAGRDVIQLRRRAWYGGCGCGRRGRRIGRGRRDGRNRRCRRDRSDGRRRRNWSIGRRRRNGSVGRRWPTRCIGRRRNKCRSWPDGNAAHSPVIALAQGSAHRKVGARAFCARRCAVFSSPTRTLRRIPILIRGCGEAYRITSLAGEHGQNEFVRTRRNR